MSANPVDNWTSTYESIGSGYRHIRQGVGTVQPLFLHRGGEKRSAKAPVFLVY